MSLRELNTSVLRSVTGLKKKELKKAIKPEGSDEDSEGSEVIRI